MVVDTSVLVAVVRGEADAPKLLKLMSDSPVRPRVSSVSLVEAGLVLGMGEYEDLLREIHDFDIQIVEFDSMCASIAIDAGWRYGKGRSKARLNFGDCCSYATAKRLGMPLLFKGKDFVHTDIEPIRASPRKRVQR